MKKILFLSFAMLFGVVIAHNLGTVAAQQIGQWQVYPSYWIVMRSVAAGKSVYCLTTAQEQMASNNKDRNVLTFNLMRYDTEDSSVKTYNCLDDLNDVSISHLAYSKEAKRLILVYDNGNIDLMDMDDNVLNVASLKESSLLDKNVNHVSVDGKMAYLATGFGFVTVDMKEGVIRDTYRLGVNVQAISVLGDRIYVATNQGLFYSTDDNKHLFDNWQKQSSVAEKYTQMLTFDNHVYALQNGTLFRVNETSMGMTKLAGGVRFLTMANERMVYVTASKIGIYENSTEVEDIDMPNEWQWLTYANGTYWACEQSEGLKGYKLNNGNMVQMVGSIHPNSPIRSLAYRAQYVGERLLVSGGINTPYSTFFPSTAMYYEDGQWTNLDEKTPGERYPNLRRWNATHIVQDPNDPTHHFVSNYRTGLYEYRNGQFVALYNCENSPLEQINNYGLNYVGCTGLQYDDEGNLWMMNQQTDTIVRIITSSGKWLSLYYDEISGVETPDDYLFTTSGVNFLVSRRVGGRGFFGFHTNGTLNTVRDDRHLLRSVLINQDGTSYSPDRFFCMTEDLDGRVWCGADQGLFVINDPTKFFDSDFSFEQIKISRNDGSGLADYLLSGVPVTCIAVDGGNRKWVGTNSNGLYLISADGQELLQHFQAEDSPLLSDNIQCLAIHPTTGVVMIGTDCGLCSYVGDATEAEETLDADNLLIYPNPVRPDYTGPIAVRGLTMDSEVKILSSTGQLVWNGTSNGGSFVWNGTNKGGRRVSSGVYHVVANTASGKKAVVGRIIVIK
mgnify:CR=1 FL=1